MCDYFHFDFLRMNLLYHRHSSEKQNIYSICSNHDILVRIRVRGDFMKRVKIIQSGYFHLDSPLALHNINFRSQRKEELLSIVERIVTRGIEENAHMILLTGDLFDSSRVSRKTLLFLYKEFMRFSGKIFISPGNHDPNIPDSPYRTFSFPDNVHIISEYEEVSLEDVDCVVCGVGFT